MTRKYRFRAHHGVHIPRHSDDWQAPIDNETVEIPCLIVRESDAAVEIDVGDEKVDQETGEITPKTVWIPRSQIKGQEPAADGNGVILTITEKCAKDKGLI